MERLDLVHLGMPFTYELLTWDEEKGDYTSTHVPCAHESGWWGAVSFGPFRKRVFVCTMCENLVPEKLMDSLENT